MSVLSFATERDLDLCRITPPAGRGLRGRVRVPGDKSISHRALLLGAIAEGDTTIEGILPAADPQSTATCLRQLGVAITDLRTPVVTVTGVGLGRFQEPLDVLDCGNSGTTLRLLMGLLAASAGRFFVVTGDSSLRSRPMGRVVQPLQQMGASIWGRQAAGRAPLAVLGQGLKPMDYRSPVASAQVKSCILLAGLGLEGTTSVTEPALSRDHSERMLRAFGAQIATDLELARVTLQGPAELRGQRVIVPGDISSAAFWLVAAAITPGSEVVVENVGINPTRTGILEVLAAMGADITLDNQREAAGEPVADLRVRHTTLQGCRIGGDLVPRLIDEIPILAVAAAFAEGETQIRDAAELRVKESDRLAAMAQQLSRLGVAVTEQADGLDIRGGRPLRGTELETYDDHRIAMSLAIAALNASGETTLGPAGAVAISYPTFWETLESLL